MPAVLDCSAVITQHTYNGETLGKRIADLPARLLPFGRREREPFRLSPSCFFGRLYTQFRLGGYFYVLRGVIFLPAVNTYTGDSFENQKICLRIYHRADKCALRRRRRNDCRSLPQKMRTFSKAGAGNGNLRHSSADRSQRRSLSSARLL